MEAEFIQIAPHVSMVKHSWTAFHIFYFLNLYLINHSQNISWAGLSFIFYCFSQNIWITKVISNCYTFQNVNIMQPTKLMVIAFLQWVFLNYWCKKNPSWYKSCLQKQETVACNHKRRQPGTCLQNTGISPTVSKECISHLKKKNSICFLHGKGIWLNLGQRKINKAYFLLESKV